jgi:rod shape-determining protein MreC
MMLLLLKTHEKNLLFNRKDTTLVQKLDSIKGVKPSDIVVSKVIHNSYNVHENYLTLNSGELEGIKPDMGVINSFKLLVLLKTLLLIMPVISILKNHKSMPKSRNQIILVL